MAKQPKDMNALRAKIIVKAWKDQRFKQLLLKNPKAAFKEMGIEVPSNLDVRVVEDKQNSFTFVLPSPVSQIEEMPNEQLEKMTGGVENIQVASALVPLSFVGCCR